MAANYNGAQAYRFELFEPQQAMPAPKKKEVPVGPQRVVEAPKKTCLLYTSDAADEL